ncbi:MAG: hypothetical protein UY42_C0030G0004 [Parcubacteria group bacterium GW2011_GWA2_49_16]|nr:MAG: hypothetical protein UY42_C0030G0004 [Parcubacteria group bacterium GW2011_GWA2_49_16]
MKSTDFVVLPRKEYEKLLATRTIPEFQPTPAEKKDLARARKERAKGNFLTIDELKHKLGLTN